MRTILLALASALTLTACEATAPAPTANSAAAPRPAASASAAPTAAAPTAAAPSASAAPAADLTTRPLESVLGGAASVTVGVREPSPGGPMTIKKSVDVKDPKSVAALLAAVGPKQLPSAGMAKCITRHELRFLDAAGKPLGTVGLCDGRGLAEAARSQGRIDVPGSQAAGITVADMGALRAALKPLDIDLP